MKMTYEEANAAAFAAEAAWVAAKADEKAALEARDVLALQAAWAALDAANAAYEEANAAARAAEDKPQSRRRRVPVAPDEYQPKGIIWGESSDECVCSYCDVCRGK